MIDLTSLLWFVFLGLVGGVAQILMKAEKWSDLKEFSAFKRSLIGAICGFLYYFLYSDYNWPNTVMTIVSGWFGTDFLLSIFKKLKKG
ncbi:unnamed protein product [marine sediment metagenome]|uniref:Holin n=1 Tax=marine sediment metagenome TaxID=412755 RepID=X1TE93_9ZZZZ